MNLLSGPSYEQALNNDEKPGNDKLGTNVRKGIQVHADGMWLTKKTPKNYCIYMLTNFEIGISASLTLLPHNQDF